MNKLILSGRIHKEIEYKETSTGSRYAIVSIFIPRQYKNQNGERESDFFGVKVFGKSVDILQYFSNGSPITFECNVRNSNYEKNDGTKVYGYDFIAESVLFPPEKKQNKTELKESEFPLV